LCFQAEVGIRDTAVTGVQTFALPIYLISKWFEYYGLEVDYFKTRPSFEELEKFYIKEKMNLNQLMKIFNVGRNTIRKWFKYDNIEIRSPQRKYAHLRKVPLTQIQKEFIVGTLLGDGYLGKQNILEIKHSHKQLKYLLHKKEIMSNYVNYIREHKKNLNITEKEYTCWSLHTIKLNELYFFRKLFYENNKKVVKRDIIRFLTPFAMAIWYMDDGWRNKNSMKISSESFTEKEHLLLKDMIKINFDINVKLCKYKRNEKEYNYLSFNKRNSILLTKLIKPYIIESMKYKLVPLEEEQFLND